MVNFDYDQMVFLAMSRFISAMLDEPLYAP
jgi:hypothetical protein